MKKNKILFLLLCVFCISCTQNLDFNQIENYSVQSKITSSFLYVTITPSNFIDEDTGLEASNFSSNEFQLDLFTSEFFRKNISKIVFDFEGKNEITRDIIFFLDFLDANGSVVYSVSPLKIEAQDLTYKYQEIIEINLNSHILQGVKCRLSRKISSSSVPLLVNDPSKVELKSAVTLFIDTE